MRQYRPRPASGLFFLKALIFFVLLLFFLLNYLGFCWKSFRFLSDKEIMDSAVVGVVRYISIDTAHYSVSGNVLPKKDMVHYSDIENFYAINPDCCQIIDFGKKADNERYEDWQASMPSFLDKILGRSCSRVQVKFKVFFSDKDGYWREKIMIPVVSNCGEIFNDWF